MGAIIFAVIIGLILVSVVFGAQQTKKRTAGLQAAAEELGLSFLDEGAGGWEHDLAGFDLMSRGRGKKYRNVTIAEAPDLKVALFDYQYTTGSGKNRRTHSQSVAAIQSPQLRMPSFRARPEGMFDTIGGALGFQDIDFDDHPQFSDAFVLKSEFESQTRQFFDMPLLDHFTEKTKLCFEGQGNVFLFYERGHRAKPENLKFLLEESYRVYGALRDRTNRQ